MALLATKMDSNEAYRTVCRRLVALGLKQVRLADEIDMSTGWVSEWLHGKAGAEYDLKNRNSDRLDRFLTELSKALDGRPAPRVRHTKEPPAAERKTG